MKKIISLTLLILIIFTSLKSPAFAEESRDISMELNNMVESIIEEGKSKGAVLSIVKDGNTELCKGYGYADEYLGYKADGNKIAFRMGSVSKTFVAVAAQILIDKGQLNMDSDISIYLESDFPKLKYPVTMKQLLTHTAGFEDMVTGMAVYNISDTEPLKVSVRKYMPNQIYKPGEVISYSNYGIALAAYVIECIANQDFAEYCEQEIFKPLDMNKTTFKFMQDIVYVSKPYLPNGNETIEPHMNLYPEGSAVSTAEDMAKYMKWLLDEDDTRILSMVSKEELFKKQFTMAEELEGIGCIWTRKTRNNNVFYEKKGETLNFYTRIVLYPKEKTGVFLSFNTYVPEKDINAVINKATSLIYGEKQDYSFDSGKASIDISGLYVNNWSNFKTPEKLLRYLIPSKMLYINGDKENGYYLSGESMVLIGEDMYSSKLGLLKFQNKDNKIIMATESAITYVKVPLWQHRSIQMLVPIIYLLITFIAFIKEIMFFLCKNKKRNRAYIINSFFQLIAFIVLCLVIYKGIRTFSLLSMSPYMKLCGLLIISSVVLNIIFMKKHKSLKEISLVAWNLSGLLFAAWMFWFHII